MKFEYLEYKNQSNFISNLSNNCKNFLPNITQKYAIRCLRRQQGIFYDACSQKCQFELSFLRLTQGLELEHFVYGLVGLFS